MKPILVSAIGSLAARPLMAHLYLGETVVRWVVLRLSAFSAPFGKADIASTTQP